MKPTGFVFYRQFCFRQGFKRAPKDLNFNTFSAFSIPLSSSQASAKHQGTTWPLSKPHHFERACFPWPVFCGQLRGWNLNGLLLNWGTHRHIGTSERESHSVRFSFWKVYIESHYVKILWVFLYTNKELGYVQTTGVLDCDLIQPTFHVSNVSWCLREKRFFPHPWAEFTLAVKVAMLIG